jgi:hypothetical protein
MQRSNFFGSLIVAKNESIAAYQSYHDRVISNHFKLDERGSTPQMVAEAIYQATNDRSDRLRYPAGKDVSLFLKLRKLLSDNLFFKLVRRQLEKPH